MNHSPSGLISDDPSVESSSPIKLGSNALVAFPKAPFTGVELADITSFISSNFLAMLVAADFRLLSPL